MDNPPEPKSKTEWETASLIAALQRRLEKVTDQRDYHRGRERAARKMLAETEAHARELHEALEQIERYSTEDHVQRRARAALSHE
jgi:bacterioferritin (cytochrome b1)